MIVVRSHFAPRHLVRYVTKSILSCGIIMRPSSDAGFAQLDNEQSPTWRRALF